MGKENQRKIILSLCGGTGAWEEPYRQHPDSYDVRNITLPDYDVRTYQPPENVYGILAAPPCTMFSFARTKAKKPRDLREGMECVRACLNIIWDCMEVKQETKKKTLRLKFWALENPAIGFLKHFLGKPALIFNPYEFGDAYQKHTALWGWFNEPKRNPVKLSPQMKKLAKTNSYLRKIKFPKFASDRPIEFRFNKDAKSITPAGFAKAFFDSNR